MSSRKGCICLMMCVVPLLFLTGSEVTRVHATEFRNTGSDATVYEKGKGNGVVRAVLEKLDSVCIFKKDKQMLRTIALASSENGMKAGTFRRGYFGGIWQVDEAAFEVTKDLSLSYLWRRFNSAFDIDWSAVKWRDLTKPLYSALAARLALASIADGSNNEVENSLPWDVQNQANMWINAFQLSGDLAVYRQIYQDAAQMLRYMSGCKSIGADIAFVMDGSGSINQTDFQGSLSFVADLVSRLDIGPSNNQVSVIVFSSSASVEFYFNTYTTKEQILQKITSGITYGGGGAAVDLALSSLHQNVFTRWNGARGADAIPQLAVLFTNGPADYALAAQLEASRVHAKNITLLSIGIGSGAHDSELRGYASLPKCRNTYHLQASSDMAQLFAFELRERSCTAHGVVILKPQDPSDTLSPPISIVLQPNQEQYICFIVPVAQGATVIVNGTTGTLTAYISFSITRPSEEDYDRRLSQLDRSTLYLTPDIIASYVGPLVLEGQICLTLATNSNGISVRASSNVTSAPDIGGGGDLMILPGPPPCGFVEERDMNDNDVMVITSPRFNQITNEPVGYRANLSCVWRINTQPSTTLEITINYFRLRTNYDVQSDRNCNGQDRVVISNTRGVVSGGYLCGSRTNGTVIPVSWTLNHTSITFTSQSFDAFPPYGFSITVRTIGGHLLSCNYSNIDLQLKKALLPHNMPVSRYQLLNSSCKAIDKGQHLWMKTEYDQCGMRKDMTEDRIFFTNQVHAAACIGPVCFDAPTVNIAFRCVLDRNVKPQSGTYYYQYPRTTLTNLQFLEGTVRVGAMMTLGRDLHFNWTAEPDFLDFLGERVYFKIEANDGNPLSSNPAFTVAADQCWTTPTPDKNDEMRFDILLDGCPTFEFLGFERYYEAEKDIFSVLPVFFITSETSLYFHCIVRVCSVGNDEHLCDRSCITPISASARSGTSPVAMKREAAMQRTVQQRFVRFGGSKAAEQMS